MADSFLRAYPDLRPFLVVNARSTGRTIGSGSYGSVEEVAIPGAVCAAKKIHDFFQDPTQISQEGIEKASREFVRECQLMSTLRHPYIVQFLGVCFLPGSRIPALVMEKLMTSLHAVLDPQPQPPTKAFIPVSMKCSILHNIASGLAFLHSHTPAIIHRDLSARNILLSVGMVAKIADLGMARIVPHMRVAATMTKAPGASIYMPPEALEDKSRYDVTIDIFSIGVLAIFVLSQTFPDPLAAAYMDDCGTMIGRTELERRDPYMHQLRRQFREGHPLLQLIRNSLKNRITERQTIQAIIQCLDEARAEIHDGYDISRLALVQALKQRAPLPQVNDEHIEQHHTKQQCQHNGWQQGENEFLKAQIKSLQEQLWAVKPAKGQLPQAMALPTPKPCQSEATPAITVQWPLQLHWKKGKDMSSDGLACASSVIVSGMVYCGGNAMSKVVMRYNHVGGDWAKLPKVPIGFTMTSLNGRLVLVGGGESGGDNLTVWDSGRSQWIDPYPPMPTGRAMSAAVGYQNYLIVACGFLCMDKVEVLDSSNGWWYSAQPVPLGGDCMSSVLVGDRWYLSSFGKWKDGKKHIFWANLPNLISSATSAHTTTTPSIWHELPTPPVESPALLSLHGHLLLVGGAGRVQELHHYDPETRQWRVSGRLPVGMCSPCCAVLPSGELMVAGGFTGDSRKTSKRVWIGKTVH